MVLGGQLFEKGYRATARQVTAATTNFSTFFIVPRRGLRRRRG
jgi:hypothetical protein